MTRGLFISVTGCMGEKKTLANTLLSFLTTRGIIPSMRFFRVAELNGTMTNGDFQAIEAGSLDASSSNQFIVAKKM
jgi:hypothetical protein